MSERILDFIGITGIGLFGEYVVYRFLTSREKFKVSDEEKKAIKDAAKEILDPEARSLYSDIIPGIHRLGTVCSYKPIQHSLVSIWGLSEDFSRIVADEYGILFNDDSKDWLDKSLGDFLNSYASGDKLATYDSIANMFSDRVTRKKIENLSKDRFANDLLQSSKALRERRLSELYSVLSNYAQRPWDDPPTLLFITLINDLVYRLKAASKGGPSYYKFAEDIADDIETVANAVRKENNWKVYVAYENILRKASRWVRPKGNEAAIKA